MTIHLPIELRTPLSTGLKLNPTQALGGAFNHCDDLYCAGNFADSRSTNMPDEKPERRQGASV